jgi:hypothetical protein
METQPQSRSVAFEQRDLIAFVEGCRPRIEADPDGAKRAQAFLDTHAVSAPVVPVRKDDRLAVKLVPDVSRR